MGLVTGDHVRKASECYFSPSLFLYCEKEASGLSPEEITRDTLHGKRQVPVKAALSWPLALGPDLAVTSSLPQQGLAGLPGYPNVLVDGSL